MEFIKQIERLQLLSKLVGEKRTGSPKELAQRLSLSRRQLYSYLEFMKDYGMDIAYSRKANSFLINNGKKIKIDLQFQVMDEKANGEISGGINLENFSSVLFLSTERI